MPASSSTVATQIEFEPDMGGVSSGLHYDETHLRPWVLSRDQQIYVAKNASARLVEDQIAQGAVLGDEARLLPQGFAWRRRNSADYHVADLAFGVAGDDVDDFRGSHDIYGAPD
jgi:hypothetical protein